MLSLYFHLLQTVDKICGWLPSSRFSTPYIYDKFMTSVFLAWRDVGWILDSRAHAGDHGTS